jgi:endonuclease YncB( thermonuclease family)
MDSSSLTPAQLDKLLHGIARSRDFTFRLAERVNALSFTEADPMKVTSIRARDTVEALYQVAPELERKAKLPKWSGGQMPHEVMPRSRRARRE